VAGWTIVASVRDRPHRHQLARRQNPGPRDPSDLRSARLRIEVLPSLGVAREADREEPDVVDGRGESRGQLWKAIEVGELADADPQGGCGLEFHAPSEGDGGIDPFIC
jgi:hypothetical protein